MPIATTLVNAILNGLFTDPAWSPPAQVWIALSTTTPNADGSNVTEPSGNAYTRIQLTAALMAAAASGSKANGSTVQFPTATGSWGVITHWALYDASTGGTFLWSGALGTARTVSANDAPDFPASTFTLSGS